MGVGVFCAEKRGWVGEENAFFEFFLREVSTAPPTARPIYPRGGDPGPSAPGQTAQRRQQGKPCQTARAGQIETAAALGCGQSLYRVYYGSATFGMVYW
jgi:hypothetical protein